MKAGWTDQLGVVDTIYEEEDQEEAEGEGDGSNSISFPPSLTATPTPPHSSSSLSSPPPSLHRSVDEWTSATGCKTDIIIRVRDLCFNLHKEPLICRSSYLRRRLTDSSDIKISPPSNITAETLTEIFTFCYDSEVNLTPSNIAPLRIGAEWFEMDDDDGSEVNSNGSLLWRTEAYFMKVIAGDARNAAHVLSTCVGMLPETTELAARCIEVLASESSGDGGWVEELTALGVEEFQVVAEGLRTWFAHDHDVLYRVVDYYLEHHNTKLTEEEKTRVCNTINCTKLSHHLLLHLVQNPRLPLRFVVQAMLVDQIHTRHSFLSTKHSSSSSVTGATSSLTLGAILQRDAALRQSLQLRASMEATAFRVKSLEKDIDSLRRRLRWSEEKKAQVESARSESFRVVRKTTKEEAVVSTKSCMGDDNAKLKSGRGIGWRIVDGLKSVFQSSPTKAGVRGVKEKQKGHMRSNSFG